MAAILNVLRKSKVDAYLLEEHSLKKIYYFESVDAGGLVV